jgi:RimJ/RimL family protein N-acetyltransferase
MRPLMLTPELSTDRLLLRAWRDEDLEPFAALNADPRVMEFFRSVLSRQESDEMVQRVRAHFDQRGFGFWALEVKGGARLAGMVGLAVPSFDAHFTPCVEIGWRLAVEHWGKGYATEAARECLRFAFQQLGLKEVVAFTAVGNFRSRRVMERIGMTRSERDDFDHPRVPEGHPLRRHVLYRVTR